MAESIIPSMFKLNKILWSGAHFMLDSQTINLSEPISKQEHGIVLVWSAYKNDQAQDYDFEFSFVPKSHTQLLPGRGCNFILTTFNSAANKYLYIHDDKIIGHAQNDDVYTGSSSAIHFENNVYVLRYVIGV